MKTQLVINLLPQNNDTIPFFLQRDVTVIVDSVTENEFLSNQFLKLDSSKVFYDVDALGSIIFSSRLEGIARPFMQQFGSVLFLIFALIFILFALTFKINGRELFSNFGYIFSFGSRNKNFYSKQVTTSDVWTNLFWVFQAFVIYSILFFDLTLQHSPLILNEQDYIVLFLQIFGVLSLFVFGKYILYKFIEGVVSDIKTNFLIDAYMWVVYITGILSFIPIIVYIYIPEMRTYVLFFLLLIFILGRLTVITKSYAFFVKSHIGILYFFVYLCGVEIMPYLLLFKAIVLIN